MTFEISFLNNTYWVNGRDFPDMASATAYLCDKLHEAPPRPTTLMQAYKLSTPLLSITDNSDADKAIQMNDTWGYDQLPTKAMALSVNAYMKILVLLHSMRGYDIDGQDLFIPIIYKERIELIGANIRKHPGAGSRENWNHIIQHFPHLVAQWLSFPL
jgi:hypothetical protein